MWGKRGDSKLFGCSERMLTRNSVSGVASGADEEASSQHNHHVISHMWTCLCVRATRNQHPEKSPHNLNTCPTDCTSASPAHPPSQDKGEEHGHAPGVLEDPSSLLSSKQLKQVEKIVQEAGEVPAYLRQKDIDKTLKEHMSHVRVPQARWQPATANSKTAAWR